VKWREMLRRCHSEKWLINNPTYRGCTVCKDWLVFSNFKKWVDTQPCRDWKSKQLDKDFLICGNKEYSPITCVFLGGHVNKFLNTRDAARGECVIGVQKRDNEKTNPYLAACKDPFKRYKPYIGVFPTEQEAHFAWKKRKHQYASELAELESDPRVQEVLRTRYK
jgi:hypothetical protein